MPSTSEISLKDCLPTVFLYTTIARIHNLVARKEVFKKYKQNPATVHILIHTVFTCILEQLKTNEIFLFWGLIFKVLPVGLVFFLPQITSLCSGSVRVIFFYQFMAQLSV